MNTLHRLSILLELIVAGMGVTLAVKKKKRYGWCIALTFAIYVFYDLAMANFMALNLPEAVLRGLFFIATISILWAVWQVYQDKQ